MRGAAVMLALVWILGVPRGGEAQASNWLEDSRDALDVQWILGTQITPRSLGSFGSYEITQDAWPAVGASLRAGKQAQGFSTRFEVMLVPGVALRRNAPACDECTPASERLSLLSSRFLGDYTIPFAAGSRGYLTGGMVMRVQLSELDPCPADRGQDCALQEFARSRVDPGFMMGVGWIPANSWVQAVQFAGRMSLYGRGARPEAYPSVLLSELDLSVRFSPRR